MASDYSYIGENLDIIREKINKAERNRDNKYNSGKVKLVAVTKTVGAEKINFAVSRGVNLIGESRVQELLAKYDKLDRDNLGIHFIGSLQTNKVKYIIDKVSLFQSVNSVRLAEEINKRASQHNIKADILIEVNICGEESKTGIDGNGGRVTEFIKSLKDFDNLRIKGLMTIPPPPGKLEENEILKVFGRIHEIFLDMQSKKTDNTDNTETDINILSAGMSEDFERAIAFGSNMVRIGSALFGKRL
ncbi:MAG: YggS family pyridoxal phosphate-dependent enzyme [Oscillospiraceae bacterium]|nr:YggS family pyridoxal phosphate-dependent enzyme [Oscillospiraceae bacterium]